MVAKCLALLPRSKKGFKTQLIQAHHPKANRLGMPAEQQLLRTDHYEQFSSIMAIKSSFFEEEDEFPLIWEDSAAAGRLGNAGGLSFMKIVWLFLFFS